MNTKKKTKVIKGYAVYNKDFGGIFNSAPEGNDLFVAIFPDKGWAKKWFARDLDDYEKSRSKIIPCQIIITTPKGNK